MSVIKWIVKGVFPFVVGCKDFQVLCLFCWSFCAEQQIMQQCSAAQQNTFYSVPTFLLFCALVPVLYSRAPQRWLNFRFSDMSFHWRPPASSSLATAEESWALTIMLQEEAKMTPCPPNLLPIYKVQVRHFHASACTAKDEILAAHH